MRYRIAVLLVAIVLVASPAIAQTQPCVSGTLANVIGTSCSIGNLTFTFQNDFGGFHQIDDATNTLQTTFLTPDAIGFVPVNTSTETGFTLITNFDEATDPFTQTFSSSDIHFTYGVQVNGDFEITGETSSVSGSVTQVFLNSIAAFDEHCFTNQQCLQVAPGITFFQGSLSDESTVSKTLGMPALATQPGDPSGLPFTTAISASAFSGDHAVLNSANFLYTVLPQLPLPPLAKLKYQNIDFPDAALTEFVAINDAGDMVGSFQDLGGAFHGFRLGQGGLREITVPNAAGTFPESINDAGDIAGAFLDSAGSFHGFVLKDGEFTTLDFPGAIRTIPFGINDKGVVVGTYQLNRIGVHAFRFDENGFTTIDDPDQVPSGLTEALGINDRGDATGVFIDQQFNLRAFLLSGGAFTDIQVPGGFQPSGSGLNDLGGVIGNYEDLNLSLHGFVDVRSNFRTVDFPGSNGTFPFGINNRGVIVGAYFDAAGQLHSFRADPLPDDGSRVAPADTSNRPTPGRRCSAGDMASRKDLRNPYSCPAK